MQGTSSGRVLATCNEMAAGGCIQGAVVSGSSRRPLVPWLFVCGMGSSASAVTGRRSPKDFASIDEPYMTSIAKNFIVDHAVARERCANRSPVTRCDSRRRYK